MVYKALHIPVINPISSLTFSHFLSLLNLNLFSSLIGILFLPMDLCACPSLDLEHWAAFALYRLMNTLPL